MPESIDTVHRDLTLEGSVPADDPIEIPVPREGEFEIRDVQGAVFLRLNTRDHERRPCRVGETLCWEGDSRLRRVLFDNGGGDGGSVEYEIRVGYTIRGFGGSDARDRELPQPSRLAGDLAPGTTIAVGATAAEDIDVDQAERRLRVRAKLTGQTSFVEDDGLAPIGMGVAVVEGQAGDPDYALNTEYFSPAVATLQTVDLSDPSNLVELDSLVEAAVVRAYDVVYLSAQEAACVLAYDGADMVLYRYDVSDPTAVTLVDSLVVVAGAESGRFGEMLQVYEGLGGDPIVVGIGGETIFAVEATAGLGNMSVAATSTANYDFLVGDPGRGLAFAKRTATGPNTGLVVFSVAADGTLTQVSSDLGRWEGGGQAILVDAAHDRLWLNGWTGASVGTGWVVLDVSDPTFVRDLATHDDIEGLSGSGSNATSAVDADGVLAVCTSGASSSAQLLNIADPDDPRHLGTVASAARGAEFYAPVSGLWAIVGNDSANLQALTVDAGSDRLELIPLLTDGTPAATGRATVTGIRDGEEVLIDLGVEGEARVRIRATAAGPNQSTVEYVEEYQR